MRIVLNPTAGLHATDRGRVSRRVVFAAAVLSLLAGWVHLAYMDSHFSEWWAYGAFFLATGAGQALYAPVIVRWPSPSVIWAGIAGNLAIVGMYVLSRTEGVPLGPHAHIPEVAGAVDLATTAVELSLVVILLSLLGATARVRASNALLLTGTLLWVCRLTGVLA